MSDQSNAVEGLGGDLIANLDKTISLIEPILKNLETDLTYQHNPSERTGVIRRITAIRQ